MWCLSTMFDSSFVKKNVWKYSLRDMSMQNLFATVSFLWTCMEGGLDANVYMSTVENWLGVGQRLLGMRNLSRFKQYLWIIIIFSSLDLAPTLHLVFAPDPDPALGYLLNMHFFNLTFPSSLSREVPILFKKKKLIFDKMDWKNLKKVW
jgi:hypothetical protein